MLFALLFQVIFIGGCTQLGTTKPDEGEWHNLSILDFEVQETESRNETTIANTEELNEMPREFKEEAKGKSINSEVMNPQTNCC